MMGTENMGQDMALLQTIRHYRAKALFDKDAEIAVLRKALTELLDCPFDIDKATVAACGLEETMRINPHQVVGNMSVSLARIRQARKAIAQAVQPS
jgi:hypothetical protein